MTRVGSPQYTPFESEFEPPSPFRSRAGPGRDGKLSHEPSRAVKWMGCAGTGYDLHGPCRASRFVVFVQLCFLLRPRASTLPPRVGVPTLESRRFTPLRSQHNRLKSSPELHPWNPNVARKFQCFGRSPLASTASLSLLIRQLMNRQSVADGVGSSEFKLRGWSVSFLVNY